MRKEEASPHHFCYLPRQSHTAVSGRTFLYFPRLEHRIWRIQHGSKSLVHMSMVTEYSLSWLSQVREGIALFIVIYNLVRSWLCGPGAEGDGMLFVQNSLWAHELSSAGRTRVGSPDVRGPAHLHGVGVRVDLKGEGRHRDGAACLQAADGGLNKNPQSLKRRSSRDEEREAKATIYTVLHFCELNSSFESISQTFKWDRNDFFLEMYTFWMKCKGSILA